MSRICLYYRTPPETNRWVAGDRFIRPAVRRIIRGRPRPGGVDKVFSNLCLGLDRLRVDYHVNLPFDRLNDDDRVAVLGRGRYSLEGYDRDIPVVAGIGLMTHPSEWPTLCSEYPVVRYLQHSEWANNVYKRYFGDRCEVWPVGIDTDAWPAREATKEWDILVYDKIHWNRTEVETELVRPIKRILDRRALRYTEVKYGSYDESTFRDLVSRSKAMLFLCEHESQGLAYQECLSSNVPILAWDQGRCLDPNRFQWGSPEIPVTSVPYFDQSCGEKFRGLPDFEQQLDLFLQRLRSAEFQPRQYILDRLTLKQCASRFVDILDGVRAPRVLPSSVLPASLAAESHQ
jgi:hypothetical protein